MKTYKRIISLAVSALLISAVSIVNVMPVFAEEIEEQAVAETEVLNWNKYEPNNELVISNDKLPGSVIAGKMTANKPMVIWTETPLGEGDRQKVWDSLKGNPGVGNPKEVVYIDGDNSSLYGMTIDRENGIVRFDGKNNWSLIYTGEYKVKRPGQNVESGPDADSEPNVEKAPDMEAEPTVDSEPDVAPDPVIDSAPETDNIPEQIVPETNKTGGNKTGGHSSGESRKTGITNGTPGVLHVLDNQPDTGLMDIIKGRQLDDTPKTGMPFEFIIFLAVSAISLVSLAATLYIEKKTSTEKHNR